MSTFLGEIRIFAGNFAPVGWMFCEGQLLPISEYESLFNLIGTTYGGDGQQSFALPDLRGRLPMHMGGGFVLAETGGAEQITLTVQQIPAHGHSLLSNSNSANSSNPENAVLAEQLAVSAYQSQPAATPMAAQSIGATGGSQPHENMQPYLCVDFIIAIEGPYPPPS